jgi:hypothetical protein
MSDDSTAFGSDKKPSVFIKKREGGQSRPPSAGGGHHNNAPQPSNKYFSAHNYDVAAKKRNLNVNKLKPSVFPSSSSQVDSYTQKKILSNIPTSSSISVPESIETDGLQLSILARLKTLEGQVANYRHQLLMKDAQVKELTSKVNKDSQQHRQVVSALKQVLCYMDEHHIRHNFNAFYNLVDHEREIPAVKEEIEAGGTPQQQQQPEAGPAENEPEEHYPRINISIVQQKIADLNRLVPDDARSVSSVSGISQLKNKPTCKIIFYKNGISVDDGPFRPYQWDITRALLNDIADGYFPYEFKDKHPDGVRLEAVDRIEQMYSKFTETDKKLAQYNKDHGNVKDLSYLNILSDGEGKMDKETFLNQLPKNVIRNGKVIPIRSEIGEMMGVKELQEINIETECQKELTKNENDVELKKKTAWLKIKSPTTNQNFTVSLYQTETIGQLIRLLRPYLKRDDFELRTTYPARTYTDVNETLQTAKLTPKATMYVFIDTSKKQ